MALIICTYCKREISNKAEVCPSCRHPIKSQKMTKLGIIIAIIGLIIMIFLIVKQCPTQTEKRLDAIEEIIGKK